MINKISKLLLICFLLNLETSNTKTQNFLEETKFLKDFNNEPKPAFSYEEETSNTDQQFKQISNNIEDEVAVIIEMKKIIKEFEDKKNLSINSQKNEKTRKKIVQNADVQLSLKLRTQNTFKMLCFMHNH